jgi:hypothetical protein
MIAIGQACRSATAHQPRIDSRQSATQNGWSRECRTSHDRGASKFVFFSAKLNLVISFAIEFRTALAAAA